MPPTEGENNYTVLDHNYWDDVTKIYKKGAWEQALRDMYDEKK